MKETEFHNAASLSIAMLFPAMFYASVGWLPLLALCGISLLFHFGIPQHHSMPLLDGILLFLLIVNQTTHMQIALGGLAPVIILILLAATVNNMDRSGRITGVLIWVQSALLLVLLITGIPKMHITNLRQIVGTMDWTLIPVLWLPMFLERGTSKGWRAGIYAQFPILAIWCVGILSLAGIMTASDPFLTAAQQCSLSGSITRLDGVVYLLAAFSVFAFLAYCFCLITSELKVKSICLATVLIIIALCNVSMDSRLLAAATTIRWVILPQITQYRKKYTNWENKRENT